MINVNEIHEDKAGRALSIIHLYVLEDSSAISFLFLSPLPLHSFEGGREKRTLYLLAHFSSNYDILSSSRVQRFLVEWNRIK